MLTIGQVVKWDIPRRNKGPQDLYDILAEHFGKEFENLSGTVAFAHSKAEPDDEKNTVLMRMSGFITFPENNYPTPEMYMTVKEQFPNTFNVGFMSARPHSVELDKVMRQEDFDEMRRLFKAWADTPEAKRIGFNGTYGPMEKVFDVQVAQTPNSGPRSRGSETGIWSYGKEDFIPFKVLTGEQEIECDCPKCEPDGVKAKLLEVLRKIAEVDPSAKGMQGQSASELIEEATRGSVRTCKEVRRKVRAEISDDDDDTPDSSGILSFDPSKRKGPKSVH